MLLNIIEWKRGKLKNNKLIKICIYYIVSECHKLRDTNFDRLGSDIVDVCFIMNEIISTRNEGGAV